MDKLKIIKITVFILTFLLVFGSLVFLGSLFKQTHSKSSILPANINFSEPLGSSIKNIFSADKLLYITVEGGGYSDRVILFNPATGQKISTVSLN